MKTTIETINGKPCTVIRRPFDAEWVREQLAIKIPVQVRISDEDMTIRTLIGVCGDVFESPEDYFFNAHEIMGIINILPDLPRCPKAEHAKLLHRYASEGLTAICEHYEDHGVGVLERLETPVMYCLDSSYAHEITHCVNEQGERVEVAIAEQSPEALKE